MISIVICSRTTDISLELKDNISNTIGAKYELIIIDNSTNKHTIFTAYNEGVNRSNGDILCFMHDDIVYHTKDWGNSVIAHFNDNKVGLIGVLGTHYLPKCPSYWTYTNTYSGKYIQLRKQNDIVNDELIEHKDYFYDNSIEAVVVDGLWFCIPKKIFNNVRFDDILFRSFHGYDMDICLQVREKGFKVLVVFDILIEHRNVNGINAYDNLVENIILLNKKWKGSLPQVAGISIDSNELNIREVYMKNYFDLIIEYNKSLCEIKRLSNSKAYLIGKKIIKPFSYIICLFKINNRNYK